MQKPAAQLPRKPLVLPDHEGYVILECKRCHDQFYVPKKKNETQDDVNKWYVQFPFCASCAQTPKPTMTMHPKLNTNWNPGAWNPETHGAGLLK